MLTNIGKRLKEQFLLLWRMHRSLLLVMGLFVVLGTAFLVRSMAATEPPMETASGEFIHGVADDFKSGHETDRYTLRQTDGQYVDVTVDPAKTGKLPRTGSKVHIRGRHHDRKIDVTNEAGAGITVDAAPSTTSPNVGPAQLSQPSAGAAAPNGASTAPRTYTRGVLMVRINDASGSSAIGLQPNPRTTTEENGYLGGSYGVDKYWSATSYGQLSLTSKVLGTVTITVSDADCNLSTVQTWADKADAAAAAAGINTAQYTNMAYMLPIDSQRAGSASCQWGGLSDINGRRTWLQYAYAGYNSDNSMTLYLMGTEAHEFGHNLGLLHSATYRCMLNGQPVVLSTSCSADTYGDPWDVMGSQADYRLLDSYHREQLGFIPSSKIQTVTASGTYTIASSDLTPSSTTLPQSLRVARPNSYPAQYYEIETRTNNDPFFDIYSSDDKVVQGFTLRIVPAVRNSELDYSYLLNSEPSSPTEYAAPFYDEVFSDTAAQTAVRLVSRTDTTVTLSVMVNGVVPPPPTGDNIYPQVTLTSPKSASTYTVGDTVPFTASAIDNMAVSKVEFYDGNTLLGTAATPPYSFNWKTAGAAAGSHTVKAQAFDPSGNYSWSTAAITMKAGTSTDTQAPTVTMAAPSSTTYTIGTTVSLSAAASDDVHVARVEFYDGAALISTDSSSPYTSSWNTAGLAAGTHNLIVKAYDDAGNMNQTNPVPVILTNAPSPPPPSPLTSGDANGDRSVDSLDFALLYQHQNDNPIFKNVDFNNDGRVNAADLSILIHNWSL